MSAITGSNRDASGSDSRSRTGDVEDAVLAVAERGSGFAARPCANLAAELAADRAAGAGHEHRLPLEVAAGLRAARLIGPRRSRSVMSTSPQPADADAALEQLEDAGTAFGPDAGCDGRRRAWRERRRRRRVGIAMITSSMRCASTTFPKLLEGAEHRHACRSACRAWRGSIVEEADRTHAQLADSAASRGRPSRRRRRRRRSAPASTAASPATRPWPVERLGKQADRHAHSAHAGKRQQPVDGEDRAREDVHDAA